MDGGSFVNCSCPVKPNSQGRQAPGLLNWLFLAWLSLRGAGRGLGLLSALSLWCRREEAEEEELGDE